MLQPKDCFNNILVIRTDRIGDVILSTPVLKTLKDNFPKSRITIMVSPYTKEVVDGNPYIDEFIVYDKDTNDKDIIRFLRFVLELKKKRFDLAIILHTKKRTNLIAYLAGIPRRIGYYDKNFGFMLTDKIRDTRMLGLKHEVDYCLDILKNIGLRAEDRQLYMPLKKESLEWRDNLLKSYGIGPDDRLAAINPGASCPSKRWMKERFVVLANRLFEDHRFKVILVSGAQDAAIATDIERNSRYPIINLSGKTTISELTALLARCAIFISNDSGPVHIASAIGTPVVSIFGRNEAGLSPVRWGPLGSRSKYLHKEVGCSVCLAHNCQIDFTCLKAITVDDVLKTVDELLPIF